MRIFFTDEPRQIFNFRSTCKNQLSHHLISLTLSLSLSLCIYLSIYLSNPQSIYLSVPMSIHSSIHLAVSFYSEAGEHITRLLQVTETFVCGEHRIEGSDRRHQRRGRVSILLGTTAACIAKKNELNSPEEANYEKLIQLTSMRKNVNSNYEISRLSGLNEGPGQQFCALCVHLYSNYYCFPHLHPPIGNPSKVLTENRSSVRSSKANG